MLTLHNCSLLVVLYLAAAAIVSFWRWIRGKPDEDASPNGSESPTVWRLHDWPNEPEHFNSRCDCVLIPARPPTFRLERSGGYDSVYDRELLKGRVIIAPIPKTTGASPPPGSKPKLN